MTASQSYAFATDASEGRSDTDTDDDHEELHTRHIDHHHGADGRPHLPPSLLFELLEARYREQAQAKPAPAKQPAPTDEEELEEVQTLLSRLIEQRKKWELERSK
jgi:hypothetical protein